MDLNFDVEDIINFIFKGAPVLPDPERPQVPQMPGAQGRQGLSTTPTSGSKSTSSLGKIVRSESQSSLSTYSAFDADKQIGSRDNPPQGDGKVQTNPSMSTDIIEHLLLAPGKLHLIPWAMS